MARRRGNPNWGKPIPYLLPGTTEFERVVQSLHLEPYQYEHSKSLRAWATKNKNRVYVPEALLDAWNLLVDDESNLHYTGATQVAEDSKGMRTTTALAKVKPSK